MTQQKMDLNDPELKKLQYQEVLDREALTFEDMIKIVDELSELKREYSYQLELITDERKIN